MKRIDHILASLVFVSVLAAGAWANITNGQFATGLDGWQVLSKYPSGDDAGVEWTSWFGYYSAGAAQFSQYDEADAADSILYQRFIVNGPGDPTTPYTSLSFYFYPEGISETDYLYFSLEAEYIGGPTIPPFYSNALLWNSSMVNYPDDWPSVAGITITPETGIGAGWYGVEVDIEDGWISDTYDTYLGLMFTLESHPGDGSISLVTLDDVSLNATVIPAPGAIVLVAIGLGSLGMVRRRKAG